MATAKKTAAKTPAQKTAVEPSMRFHHSQALRKKTLQVLDALEAEPEHPAHGATLADLVTELVEAGMDYYFMRGLKSANVGFVTEQSARLGLTGAVTLISSVSRKYIVRMEPKQLQAIGVHIRALT